ncbi:MAG: hypothetical protein R3Y46_01545 [Opitutales bacterium]
MAIDTYMLIGTPYTGRKNIVKECFEKVITDSEKTLVLLSKDEAGLDTYIESLKKFENAVVFVYQDKEEARDFIANEQNAQWLFYIANPSENLADEMEFAKELNEYQLIRMVRILGFVDCNLYASKWNDVENYYDALSHFSDCLMLSNRSNLQNNHIEAIKKRYEKMYRPHRVYLIDKNHRTSDINFLMIDEARRMTFIFDDHDAIDDLDLDEDSLPVEPFDLKKKEDEYLLRIDTGVRAKAIDNIFEIAKGYNERD